MSAIEKTIQVLKDTWYKRRWVILAVVVCFSAIIELSEIYHNPAYINSTQFLVEIVVQGVILPALLIILQRTETQKTHAKKSLSFLEKFVNQLNNAGSWDELIDIIVHGLHESVPLAASTSRALRASRLSPALRCTTSAPAR